MYKRQVESYVARAKELGTEWGKRPAAERAAALDAVADQLAAKRGDFISVAAYEANKTVTQTDPEVSEAIDFCTYYGQSARFLEEAHSEFHPHTVTVVTPPWNFPIAIPTGGIAASLAAGSAVTVSYTHLTLPTIYSV